MIGCFRTTVAQEGVGALYRGLISPVLGYGLIKATAFASYNHAKSWVITNNHGGDKSKRQRHERNMGTQGHSV